MAGPVCCDLLGDGKISATKSDAVGDVSADVDTQAREILEDGCNNEDDP